MTGIQRSPIPAVRLVTGRTAVLVDLENLLHRHEGGPAPAEVRGGWCCPDPDSHETLPDPTARYGDLYSWVCPTTAAARLDAVRRVAPDADYRLAAAITPLLCHVAFLPQMAGVATRPVPPTPDAADDYLLDIAEHLAQVGFTRFVVASGDGAFTDFAAAHETVVVARNGRMLSADLRAAAAEVHLIEGPDGLLATGPAGAPAAGLRHPA
jgi:hypothetical protein